MTQSFKSTNYLKLTKLVEDGSLMKLIKDKIETKGDD